MTSPPHTQLGEICIQVEIQKEHPQERTRRTQYVRVRTERVRMPPSLWTTPQAGVRVVSGSMTP